MFASICVHQQRCNEQNTEKEQTSSSIFFLSSSLHAADDGRSPAAAISGFGDARGDTCTQ